MTWRETALAWRIHAAGARHGELTQMRDSFARARNIRPSTVRRAAQTLETAEELERAFPRFQSLDVPGDDLTVLGRLLHLGPEYVEEVLDAVMARTLMGRGLLARERELRARAAGLASAPPGGRASRQWARSFREEALLTVAAAAATGGWARIGSREALTPLAIDAVLRGDDGRWSCFRILPAAAAAAERRRLNDASAAALAAARVFDASWLITETAEDAAALIAELAAFAGSGVAVTRLASVDGSLLGTYPDRVAPPDLAAALRDRLPPLGG